MSKTGLLVKMHWLPWTGTRVTVIVVREESLCMILDTCTPEANENVFYYLLCFCLFHHVCPHSLNASAS